MSDSEPNIDERNRAVLRAYETAALYLREHNGGYPLQLLLIDLAACCIAYVYGATEGQLSHAEIAEHVVRVSQEIVADKVPTGVA